VKRSTTPGGTYSTVASGVTATSYTDTGLSNGITYYYVVSAANANGTGPDSAEVSVVPSNLVVHLKFDETGGSTSADSSGRAYHATLFNTPTFSPGIFGNTLNLPATAAQHARLPSGVTSGLTDFTVSTWVKINAFATWQRIFDFGTGTDNYMFLTAQGPAGAGRLRFGIRTPSIAEQGVNGTGIALAADAWTHVAVTRSGTTVSLYVNGSLTGSGTVSINPSDLGVTTLNYLGRSQFNDPYLNAALDDFRLYSHAMSPAEIAAFAQPQTGAPMQLTAAPGDTRATLTWLPNATTTYTVKRSTTSGGPYATVAEGVTELAYTDTGLTNELTYYYVVSGTNAQGPGADSAEVAVTPSSLALLLKFDETGGTVAADFSGRGRHATLVNGPGFAAGKLDNALNFPATASQHATLPSGIVGDLTDFTVSTWVKVNAFATWQRIFDFGTGTTNYMFLTTQYGTGGSAAKLRFGIRTSTVAEQSVSGTIALVAGTWTHVAVTRSGSTVSLYVNGSLAGSGTIALNPSDLGVTTQNYLAKSQFNDPYFNGSLDDFRLYSQALSPAEIALFSAPLDAPQNLNGEPGEAQIALSWDAVAGATGYTVRRAPDIGGPYSDHATGIAGTTYLDSGLAPGTTWHYTVTAHGLPGAGPPSDSVSATAYSAQESWRVSHFGAPSNSGDAADDADPDGDGWNNANEFAAGTDPNDPASLLEITGLAFTGQDVTIGFPTVSGRSYRVEKSATLSDGSWLTVASPVPGTGGAVEITDSGARSQPRWFYRIAVLP
jgi:hypothetical protein